MHTHHSHSGDYVQHAKDSLNDVIADACSKGFDVFCLTEHIPRYRHEDLYPEEVATNTTPADLILTFEKYYQHASQIKKELNEKRRNEKKQAKKSGTAIDKITPLIILGFECEGYSDACLEHVENIQKLHHFDTFIGSVHHVHGIPIDYSTEKWEQAAQISLRNLEELEAKQSKKTGPDDEDPKHKAHRALMRDYFDLQFKLFQKVTPPIIGHFDLIRLFSPKEYLPQLTSPSTNLAEYEQTDCFEKEFPDVWEKIVRNVKYAAAYGALFEINSAAVRKGWPTPYPGPDVAKVVLEHNGQFCLSDDSHGTAQVGLNYHVSLKYLQDLKAKNLYYLSLASDDDNDLPEVLDRTVIKSIPLQEAAKSSFWEQYETK